MAVNFTVFEDFAVVKGVRLGVAQAGVRKKDRDDMVIFELAEGTEVAGVFTTNAFCAAPVHICRRNLEKAVSYTHLTLPTNDQV